MRQTIPQRDRPGQEEYIKNKPQNVYSHMLGKIWPVESTPKQRVYNVLKFRGRG